MRRLPRWRSPCRRGAAASASNSYKVKIDKASDTVETLARQGFDVTEGGKGRSIEIVATATQARKLARSRACARGSTRAEGGRDRAARAHGRGTGLAGLAAVPAHRRRAERRRGQPEDNLVTQLEKLEQKYPKLADLQQIGTTHPRAADLRACA